MKYRIYGQFTGNTGDKSESIPCAVYLNPRKLRIVGMTRESMKVVIDPWME